LIKKIFANLQTFFVTWIIILLINQIFIFGACFAPYCLLAALPHTGVIAGLIVYFIISEESNSDKNNSISQYNKSNTSEQYSYVVDKVEKSDLIEDIKEPYCPKCGSKMVLRTAKQGKYSGSKFWGCSKFPQCNAVINV